MTAAWLVRGDARQLPLADKSVQCVVTSPPYLGLRWYGGQASVWGGDPSCSHALEDDPARRAMTGGTGPASAKQVTNNGSQFGNAWVEETRTAEIRVGLGLADSPASTRGGAKKAQTIPKIVATTGTCSLCGAMRCELGSEPDPQSFVAHLVEVFRECWRVLRDDGVCFVNIGDSMAGSGKGPTGKNGIQAAEKRQGFRPGNPEKNGGNSNRDGLSGVPGTRPKSLLLVPERLAIALSDDGWTVRQVLIWAKNNPMPESVRDRWTTAHEYVLMLVKQGRYFFDQTAIQEPYSLSSWTAEQEMAGGLARGQQGWRSSDKTRAYADGAADGQVRGASSMRNGGYTQGGRNGRSVWNLNADPYPGAHFATFPREIPRRCIAAATREGDVVLDPFSGSGTTAFVAASLGRRGVGVDLSAEYTQQARYGRLAQEFLPLGASV